MHRPELSIRPAVPADLDEVMDIYAHARAEMAASGNPDQWGDIHPPRELIEADIAAGKLYVCVAEHDSIAAVFYFAVENDPTYTQIAGAWLDDAAPYGVVHRIARAPWARGAGAFCMEWCYARCGNVRVDTHRANAPMVGTLARLGYTHCGVIRLGLFDDPELDEREAFQKYKSNHALTRQRELTHTLRDAARAYYHENREIMTDREYDALYDELVLLEAQTGTVMAGSPTQRVGYTGVQVVDALKKVPHAVPMLSLDKTKEIGELAAFLQSESGLLTWKLDGLAISVTYENGELVQALTRGNGTIGEDVTHNARVFTNIPLRVSHMGQFTVRGEAVISFADFEAINAALPPEEAYKNPRNLCSGSVRQLDSEVAAGRRVRFYAIGVAGEGVQTSADKADSSLPANTKSAQLQWLAELGFDTVPHMLVSSGSVPAAVEHFKEEIARAGIATDGLVLTFDNIAYGASLGATSKFPRDSIAFKWADELQETTLTHIEWNTSRTGLINPVAVFEPVELEGTTVSRASVHNVSVLRELELCAGDRITVYKANMIIPQVAENLSRGGSVPVPHACPECSAATEVVPGPSGEALYCTGAHCPAQRVQALSHFASRDAMNIAGLSEQTLEKLISIGAVENYADLFTLREHEARIISLDGFGRKSFDKLIAAIERARDVALPNFLTALGIRHMGLANAKLLAAHFNHDIEKIISVCGGADFAQELGEIKGFGEAIAASLHRFFTDGENLELLARVLPLLRFPQVEVSAQARPLEGLTFVITGDVTRFANRKELQNFIEQHGGKTTGSVTNKTSYLINNDSASKSGKNKKAAELGVPVLNEEDFMKLVPVE